MNVNLDDNAMNVVRDGSVTLTIRKILLLQRTFARIWTQSPKKKKKILASGSAPAPPGGERLPEPGSGPSPGVADRGRTAS